MKPYFWWGMGLYYGFIFLMMILEMKIPGMTYQVSIGGVPASFFYNHLIALYLLPTAIAYLFYWIPEQQDKKAKEQEAGKNVS
jgi:hypothetical protein